MGRRWGKTLMAGTFALSVANHGGAVAWVVPTYKNARPTWRFCEKLVKPIGNSVAVNKTERTIEFPSGGWLGVYSADNDVGLRGESFDLVIVDEAAQIAEETYTDVILPTLADRDGRCVLISTPRGLNWFFREYQAALGEMQPDAGHPDRAAWQAPTTDNPMPTIQRAAELARERVSERTYRQEWLAEFVTDEGAVFRKVLQAATATAQDRAEAGHRYCAGVDWAAVGDYTVVTVIDLATREQVAIDRFNKIDFDFQCERVKALCDRFKPSLVVVEENGIGKGPAQRLAKMIGTRVHLWTASNASKDEAVKALSLALEKGEITLLADKVQTGELLAYEGTKLPSGMIRYGAPQGMHDDTVVALMLANLAAQAPTREGGRMIDFEVVA